MPDSVALLSNRNEAVELANVSKNQIAFIRHQTGLTPVKAFDSAQISGLKRDYPDQVYEAVKKAILLTLLQFNVKDTMKPLQVELLIGDLLNRYYYLKIDELFYVLKEGVAGKWKRPYNHIDGPTIHGWINEYETSERPAVLERVAAEQKRLQQEPVTLPGVSDKVKLMAMYGRPADGATEAEIEQARELWQATQEKEQQRTAELEARKQRNQVKKPVTPEQYKTPEFIERLQREAPEMNYETLAGLRILFSNMEAAAALKIIDKTIASRK